MRFSALNGLNEARGVGWMCFWEFPVEDTGMYCEFEDELIANMVK